MFMTPFSEFGKLPDNLHNVPLSPGIRKKSLPAEVRACPAPAAGPPFHRITEFPVHDAPLL
jgi:hypothetical protein